MLRLDIGRNPDSEKTSPWLILRNQQNAGALCLYPNLMGGEWNQVYKQLMAVNHFPAWPYLPFAIEENGCPGLRLSTSEIEVCLIPLHFSVP